MKSVRGYVPTEAEKRAERQARLKRRKPALTPTGRPRMRARLDLPFTDEEDNKYVRECEIVGIGEGYNSTGMYGVKIVFIEMVDYPEEGRFAIDWPIQNDLWEGYEEVERS